MHRRSTMLLILAVTLAVAAPAATAPPASTLQGYAVDTWHSFVTMTNPATGLPSDNVSAEGVRARYTSPTNVGTYLWSTLAARDLGIITSAEAQARIDRTLTTVASLERHEASGQYYNWYDPDTGQTLTVWPADGSRVYRFLSSVDNGWLAAALIMVANAVPELAAKAEAIESSMDFGFYYDPNAGLLRGGAWTEPPPGCSVYDEAKQVWFTCHHYGALNTEPRIASYIGIARGQIPATHYYKMWRTFPPTCDWGWQEMQPEGVTRTYLGVDVYEGHYTYRGMNIVPSWGGSMFEALMVPLLVPEEQWAPTSWGINHPLYVRAQIEHGKEEARYGYWGFSPSNNPDGGYREYGVDPIGLNPDGYASDQERTLVDYGFGDCRPAQPEPTSYGRGVVTPHASFLALDYERGQALANLAKLRRNFDAYGTGGFYDAIDVVTGKVSRYYLALDQGMIMAAIANERTDDRFQRYFAQEVEAAVRPVIAMEEFTAGG
ncbi:MAG: glucoamylase family protein [Gaiellaceae bacterium]